MSVLLIKQNILSKKIKNMLIMTLILGLKIYKNKKLVLKTKNTILFF